MTLQQIKQRFGIIGDSPLLNQALETAMQVAPTDVTVLITGESGTGKEAMPQVIHQLSPRKHARYIAVNCGAIPEGTIDSELFGHEKGAFTGAQEARKGYFEVADGGTVFLDEVGELPKETQVRLLRILESGEYMRVGSSRVQKTDVRIVGATNTDILEAIKNRKFREDLYYRLNTVPIRVPSLRERKEDIPLLFRKFAADVSDRYNMPKIRLSEDAVELLKEYRWPGNVRQLKNVTEQLSVITDERTVTKDTLLRFLPHENSSDLPAVPEGKKGENGQFQDQERELLYKVLFELKNDVNDLKNLIFELLHGTSQEWRVHQMGGKNPAEGNPQDPRTDMGGSDTFALPPSGDDIPQAQAATPTPEAPEEVEESLSLEDREKDLIKKALKRHKGKRKSAARELGISERTLYRKIKEYNIK